MEVVLGFVVGVAVGAMLGLLLAPTAHLLVGRSEWRWASRELELADRLLEALSDPDKSDSSSNEDESPRPLRTALPYGHGR
jgi:hypothetical protein